MKNSQYNPYCFTRNNRLTRQRDFDYLFSQKTRIVFTYFRVIGAFNQLPFARLGINLSKRIIKRAVDRNRLKRLIREEFRKQKMALTGLDTLILIRAKNKGFDDQEAIRSEIKKLWLNIHGGLPAS